MSETMCAGTLYAETEFQNGLTGACGPNALAMAESWARQSYVGTVAVQQRMHTAGRCDSNGVSNIGGLWQQASADGLSNALLGYQQPMAAQSWQNFLATHVGGCAVVVEVSNGQALRDFLTGNGEDAVGLQYHFITILGVNSGGVSAYAGAAGKSVPAGYWVADGDNNLLNPVVNGVRQRVINGHTLVYYPLATLAAAKPVAALAVFGKGATTNMGGVPQGWHDDATTGTLTAPNGLVVVHGFRDYVLANSWDANNLPLENEHAETLVELHNRPLGSGTIQYFRLSQLTWQQSNNAVFASWVGAEAQYMRAQIATQAAALTAAQSQVTAAQGQVATLTSQVATLQQQLAAAQASAGDQTAHAAIVALASALAALSSTSAAATVKAA